MIYTVTDITPGMDYAPGEDLIGTVEADSPDDAKIKALKAIPGMAVPISDMARNDPAGFVEHVLSMLQATPND